MSEKTPMRSSGFVTVLKQLHDIRICVDGTCCLWQCLLLKCELVLQQRHFSCLGAVTAYPLGSCLRAFWAMPMLCCLHMHVAFVPL